MKTPRLVASLALLGLLAVSSTSAAPPRALPAGTLPDDIRLQPPKDLDGYFPFTPSKTKAAWEERAAYVRRQILVAEGLWPMPTKTPLNAVIHGRIDRGEYTVEKVYFESAPGFFVTGNLYRPKNVTGKVPGVLFAHGHWKDARFFEETPEKLRQELATGQERFEIGGRNRFQSMCVQLARMGCVVWQWDMLSDSDSKQFTPEIIHRFQKQRPEMNTTANWGLFSPQAEAHLQSVMGLQTWNAVRSLDFLLSLPEIDPARVAMTGASGGGTQTMLLAAIDPRLTLSFPAVMVSTAMQGGCTCESASLLRIGTGNVEFAALFAPKPQGMTNANDWTKEMATKGFPDLKAHYAMMGAPNHVMLNRGEQFPHNYNAVSRSAFYTWLNQHYKLGQTAPVIERDYDPLRRADLTVWDDAHPAPKEAGPEFEKKLLAWFTTDAEQQLRAAAATPARFREIAAPAVEVLVGRTWANAGEIEWKLANKDDRGAYVVMTGLLHNTTHHEELPVTWLFPKQGNGRAVVWLDDAGKSSLFSPMGGVKPEVLRLVAAGTTVIGADLLFQGEFTAEGVSPKQTRTVKNPREFAGYTFGYNSSLFAQRTQDVLTLVSFLRHATSDNHPSPTSVAVAAFGRTGPIAAAARALVGAAIDRAAIDTGGFRFGQLLDYRDPMFLPGGAKYLDVPGLLALGAPNATWLAGEGASPALAAPAYASAGAEKKLSAFSGAPAEVEASAAAWLLQ